MLNSHRREHILKRLNDENRVLVSDIATSLNVSDETVRRDLKDLEKEGLLRRIHGGAINVLANRDTPIGERVQIHTKEKGVIAKLATDLIADHMSIFLHIGSTTEALARHLGRFKDLKVYTNSLNVAQIVREHFGVTVFVAPGQLRKVECDLVGYDTVRYLEGYYFDMAFMSVAGIDADRGFMDYEEDEVRIRQTVIKCARCNVMMADSSKYDRTANILTAPFTAIDHFVTDREPPAKFGKRFTAASMEVIHA